MILDLMVLVRIKLVNDQIIITAIVLSEYWIIKAINLGLILRAAFKVINWDYNKLIRLGIIPKNANIMDYCF